MGKLKKVNRSNGTDWVKSHFRIVSLESHNDKELVFAQLLQDIQKFYDELNTIRRHIGLKSPITYPINPTLEAIYKLQDRLPQEARKILNDEVIELMQRFGIPNTSLWQISFKTLILTHTFPIPADHPFVLYEPQKHIPLHFYDSNDSPKIILQSYFEPEQLKTWIEDNREILKKIGQDMPSNIGKGNDSETLFIEKIIFLLKEYENKTSKEIEEHLPAILKKANIKRTSIAYKDIDDYYKHYKDYLKQII